MATAPPSLRRTLDTLELDPKAKDDREYLISMLRRLGYTDAEIRAHIGEFETVRPPRPQRPAPVVEREPEPEPDMLAAQEHVDMYEPIRDNARTIEVEYEAEQEEEVDEYEPITRLMLEWKELQQEPEEQLDFLDVTPDEPPVEFEEPKRLRMKIVKAHDEDEALQIARGEGLDAVKAVPVFLDVERIDEHGTRVQHFTGEVTRSEWPDEAVAAPVATKEGDWPEWDDTPVATTEWSDDDEAWTDEPLADGQEGEWPDEDPADWAQAPLAPEPEPDPKPSPTLADPATQAPFHYKDYTLYTRDVELSTGRGRRIYFFAKGKPKDGIPSGLPDGHEVVENEKTGLPYLRKERDQS